MIIDAEKVKQAKEKLGDRNAEIMAELLQLDDYDSRNMKACCPYHTEDTPSFVYDRKNYRFRCFGCLTTVDIIDVMMQRGDTYIGACKKLFEYATMEYSFGEEGVKTKANYRYPHDENGDMTAVYNYWNRRGITNDTLEYLDVGSDGKGNTVFRFYDTNDVLTMVKYRPARTVQKGENKTWCQKNADTAPLLFNMNRVNTSQPLLIVEGEGDCMSAIEAGYYNTVSVPLGCGNLYWIEECWDFLEQFDSIIVAFDNDAPGKKARKDVIYRLGSWRTKYIDYPEYKLTDDGRKIPIKDMNDTLQAFGAGHVFSMIINAKDIPVTSVVDFTDVDELDISDMTGIETGLKPLDKELIKIFNGTLTILSGRPGCVDSETEYFNGTKWKKISEYEHGDKVLQYNTDGSAELVYPEQYHKYPCDSFWHLKSSHGIDQMLSDEHNIVYLTSKGNLFKKNIVEFIEQHDATKYGSEAKFITTFDYGCEGINLTDEEIRVMCMVIADGYFPHMNNRCHVRVKKTRKKERAIKLLEAAGIPYEIHQWGKKDPEYRTYVFNAPLRTKVFDDYWYKCSKHQFEIITEECIYWDGTKHNGRESYSTTIKETADFLQFAFSVSGYRSHIGVSDRRNGADRSRPIEYTISKVKAKHPSLRSRSGKKVVIEKMKAGDGYKYCFTVPSGMLVLRRDGNINITGNSGKTSLIDQTIANAIDNDFPVFLFSKEMPERMSTNWFNYILAGRRNLVEKVTPGGEKYHVVSYAAKEQIKEFYKSRLFIYKDTESNAIDDVMKSMEECVRKYGVKLLVLDNLMMLDLDCSETEKNTAQTTLVNDLIRFASKYNVSVVLIAHPKKTQDMRSDIEMYDIAGSSNIINLAMRSIGLRRISEKEQEDPKFKFGGYNVVLTIMKDRLLGKADVQMGLYYDVKSRRFFTDYDEFDHRYKWDKKTYTEKIPYPVNQERSPFD